MTRPLRIQFPGGFYYLTQHGNSDIAIFKSEDDYSNFLDILQVSMATHAVNLHGFVLLKNHFHLLVETPQANLSEFMRHLNITYTSYFNRKHSRKGHLYGGRYKSIILEKELYLSPMSQYLHLNPLNTGSIKRRSKSARLHFLNEWKWSSYHGYVGAYPRYHFVNHHVTLRPYGGDTPSGRQYYIEALQKKFKDGLAIKKEIVGQAILGSLSFIEKMEKFCQVQGQHREQPGTANISRYLLQEKILLELERSLRCNRDHLLKIPGDLRAITMDMLYRFAGLTNPAIGDLMGLDYTSVSLGRKKIRQKRLSDQSLNARMIYMEKRLSRLEKI